MSTRDEELLKQKAKSLARIAKLSKSIRDASIEVINEVEATSVTPAVDGFGFRESKALIEGIASDSLAMREEKFRLESIELLLHPASKF